MDNSKSNNRLNLIGATPTSDKKNRNGMDDIDRWAAGIGQSERQLNSMRPKRRHITR